MKTRPNESQHAKRRIARGMTLVEVLVAFAISGLAVSGIVYGYVFSLNSAERFSMSLAANAQATERMEQVRSALWDSSSSPVIDQVVSSNFPDQAVILDLAGSGIGVTYATNITTISVISTSPPLKRVRVDCIWTFGMSSQWMTNTIETCRGPDQ